MPSPHAADAPRLKAEIVARVDAGEFLNAICAAPGMPSVPAVRKWSRTDPLFGEALAAARRRGAWRRLWVIDEAMTQAFLARARAGEPIRSLLGQPGMPSQTAYRRWKTAQPPFAEAAFALLQRRNEKTREMARARRRDFDQAVADRIVARLCSGASGLKALLKSDPELPSREVVTRWRREQPEFDRVLRMHIAAKRRAGRPVPQAKVEDVIDHIVTGGTFLSYSRRPCGPSYNTLRRWMRDPNFAREVTRACEWREEWYADQIEMIAQDGPGPVCERARAIGQLKRQLARLRHRPRKPLYPKPRPKRRD